MDLDELLALAADAAYSTQPTWASEDIHAVATVIGEVTIIALRGTVSIAEWWRDLDAFGYWDPVLGTCHRGFYKAAVEIMGPISGSIGLSQKVIFTGHSFGGDVALILAALFVRAGHKNVQSVVTFGAARLGFAQLRTALRTVVVRQYRDGNDPVPQVPWPYEHATDTQIEIGVKTLNPIADHSMALYRTLVTDLIEKDTTMQRRQILAFTGAGLVAACTTTGSTITQLQQDAKTTFAGLQGAVAALSSDPKIPTATLGVINKYLTDVQTAVNNILASLTPSQTTVQSMVTAVNSLVAAANTIVPMDPAIKAILLAATVLLPVIESEIPGLTGAPLLTGPVPTPAAANTARAQLTFGATMARK